MTNQPESSPTIKTTVHKLSIPVDEDSSGPGVHYEPRLSALRNLTLLYLSEQQDREVRDASGLVPALFRRHYGIPTTGGVSDAWRLMIVEGLLERDLAPEGQPEPEHGKSRRTYRVKLLKEVPAEDLQAYRADLPRLLHIVGADESVATKAEEEPVDILVVTPRSPSELDALHGRVTRMHNALLDAAQHSTRKRRNGEVALKVRAELRGLGYPKEHIEEALHYLDEDHLALVVCKGPVEDERYLYWWVVKPGTVKRTALEKMIQQGRGYVPRGQGADIRPAAEYRRETGSTQDAAATARQTPTAAVSASDPPDSMTAPNTAALIRTPQQGQALGDIVTEIDRVLQRMEELKQENTRLREVLSTERAAHAQEAANLRGENDTLKRRIKELAEQVESLLSPDFRIKIQQALSS